MYDSLSAGATTAERFWLVFQHSSAQLQLSVEARAGRWDLRVRVDPPSATSAELQVDGSDLGIREQSGGGAFTFRAVPPGVMRISVERPGDADLQTDWFLISSRPAQG